MWQIVLTGLDPNSSAMHPDMTVQYSYGDGVNQYEAKRMLPIQHFNLYNIFVSFRVSKCTVTTNGDDVKTHN